MNQIYKTTNEDLIAILKTAESSLLYSGKIKFETSATWRNQFVPDFPGVYALFDQNELLYIGETGNLRKRMSDICRTVNHTFRKQLARKKFGADKKLKKFDEELELLLDTFFAENLYINFIEVNFGRTEIEEHLISRNQKSLLNSEKKRKLKLDLDESLTKPVIH